MAQVTALILHFLAGVVVGSLFRVRTLVFLALAVFVEAGAVVVLLGMSTGLVWLILSEFGLQFGYLSGIYLRSLLERAGIVAIAPHGRRP